MWKAHILHVLLKFTLKNVLQLMVIFFSIYIYILILASLPLSIRLSSLAPGGDDVDLQLISVGGLQASLRLRLTGFLPSSGTFVDSTFVSHMGTVCIICMSTTSC